MYFTKAAKLITKTAAVFISAFVLAYLLPKMISHVYASFSPYGLVTTYYEGINFDRTICRRPEKALLKDYQKRRPALFVPRSRFSARWKGFLLAPETAEYSFYAQSDDGLRLFIDGHMLIDNWKDNDWFTSGKHGKMHLEKGLHPIIVEHYDRQGAAALRVRWTGGPIPDNTVIGGKYLLKKKY